jgi:hypothetical protein
MINIRTLADALAKSWREGHTRAVIEGIEEHRAEVQRALCAMVMVRLDAKAAEAFEETLIDCANIDAADARFRLDGTDGLEWPATSVPS